VNVAFREPLSSSVTLNQADLPDINPVVLDESHATTLRVNPEPGTVVVAGSGAGPRAEALAVSLGAPLIAEVASGARFGPHLVPAYRHLLGDPAWSKTITRVITVGRPTLSREVSALLARTDVVHIALRGAHLEVANPSHLATVADFLEVNEEATSQQRAEWVKPWIQAGRVLQEGVLSEVSPEPPDREALESNDQAVRSSFAKKEMAVLREPVTRAVLALGVWEATWPHDRLVLGASRMIRELDRIAPGKNIPVFANRGLSGIDGTVSTARGIAKGALHSGASGITRVLLGDLSFLHDAGSLMVEPGVDDHSRVHIVVANDGGGSIFDLLEKTAEQRHHDRVLFTPHDVDLEALATAYGWDYQRVHHRGDLAEALGRSESRLVIDVSLPRY
jgi:2-succinyl-5-enolpyruvyl-6-hydroxy-3-cyclohexene-1-carboxylate synthase